MLLLNKTITYFVLKKHYNKEANSIRLNIKISTRWKNLRQDNSRDRFISVNRFGFGRIDIKLLI